MAYTVLVSSLVRTVDALPVPDPPPVIIPGDPEIPPVIPTPKPPKRDPVVVIDPPPPCLSIQAYMAGLMAWYALPGNITRGRTYVSPIPVCGGLKV